MLTAEINRAFERLPPKKISDVEPACLEIAVDVSQRAFADLGLDVAPKYGERDAVYELGSAMKSER